MGQYYSPLIKRENEYTAYDLNSGLKLTEHSWLYNSDVNAIAEMLYKNPAQLAWVGDYADETEEEKAVHQHAWGEDASLQKLPEGDGHFMEGKFLVNHDKKEYIDIEHYTEKSMYDDWCPHPLSLMTAMGNGRGGGDYRSPVNADMIGSWAMDTISVEDEAPVGFKELDVWFSEEPDKITEWEKEQSDKKYIENIVLAAKELDTVTDDSLVLDKFGKYDVTVKISRGLDTDERLVTISRELDDDEKLSYYDLEFYAPKSRNKLVSENKRYLGTSYMIEENELSKVISDIMKGSYMITTNAVKNETKSVETAVRDYNKELDKGEER